MSIYAAHDRADVVRARALVARAVPDAALTVRRGDGHWKLMMGATADHVRTLKAMDAACARDAAGAGATNAKEAR